ncbi:MAG: hypothetical protein E7220_07530, partial [Clostridiales bacterium]|nr:hypothetical protein [Clostridiales bacterium]
MRKYSEKVLLILTVMMLAAASCIPVLAEPVVIKDKDHPENELQVQSEDETQTIQRDRTSQDGTLIYGMTPV